MVRIEADAVLPFRVNVPDEDLANLRRRLSATRWPTKELVEDRSQGVQLATLRALAHYWSTEYDWRKCEARLNALPQFMTKIDGVDIHFIHVRSRHENALPLIMTHGWPGSVIELLNTVGPLTDPTKYGGNPDDAFHLVLPSLPGYGFSSEPTELGWDAARIASAWAKLMDRLGYTRYVAQGGDVGAAVTDAMGRQAPKGLLGIHVNLLAGVTAIADKLPAKSEKERAAQKAVATFRASGFGYFLEQSTRPQTIGYSLLDSPLGLAGWLLDHDTDSYYKISRAFLEGKPAGNLTRDSILDNITLYWLTGTGASAARWYWEAGQAAARVAGKSPPAVAVPVGFTTFQDDQEASPIYGIKIPKGYRNWQLISVNHLAGGNLKQVRAQLGNDIATMALREGKLPFPDGAIIAALHWKDVSSDENDKVLAMGFPGAGLQSFVAGQAVNVQFMVKDSDKYAATGGWGFADFTNGRPGNDALHKTCFSCHEPAKARDYVFTRYAP